MVLFKNSVFLKKILVTTLCIDFSIICISDLYGQCCAGANPMSGSSALSILPKGKMEFSTLYQHSFGDETYRGDILNNAKMFEKVFSNIFYLRTGYGIIERLSVYLDFTYALNKSEVLIGDSTQESRTIQGSGIGDMILMPRYSIFSTGKEKYSNELTAGLGIKIPTGEYDQYRVTLINPLTGKTDTSKNSPAVQPGTGTSDFIFNLLSISRFPHRQIFVTVNLSYILRGTNPDGQAFGDIAGISLIGGKSYKNLGGLGLEVKAEKIDSLIDPVYFSTKKNTGVRKLSVIPSLRINPSKNFTIFFSYEKPVYQYVRGVQVATKYVLLGGCTYRFQLAKSIPSVNTVSRSCYYSDPC